MSLARITIGCSRSGSLNNPTPLSEIRATWDAAVAAGILRFDTANIYAQGDSERALGALVRAHPGAGIEIHTKAGYKHSRKMELVRLAKPFLRPLLARRAAASEAVKKMRPGIDRQDFAPKMLARSFAGSLRRLDMDHVGALLLHDPDAAALAMPGLAAFLSEQIRNGRAKKVGVALRDRVNLEAALALSPIKLVQMSVTDWEAIRATGLADEMAANSVGVHVREVLNRPDGTRPSLNEALVPLLEDPRVEGILIGISRRENLYALLREISI